MVASIAEINNFIQSKLKELNKEQISAVKMAGYLDEAELLSDSSSRPGLPLRRLLRAGKIIGAEQLPNKRWLIKHCSGEELYSVSEAAAELRVTPQAVHAMVQENRIKHERLGKSIVIPKLEVVAKKLSRSRQAFSGKEFLEQKASYSGLLLYEIKSEIKSIRDEIEIILHRLIKIERLIVSGGRNDTA